MAPKRKRVLTEAEKVKRRKTSRDWRAYKMAFMNDLRNYREHCRRVVTQYTQLRTLKGKMEPMVEATVQCDYTENWKCGYQDEISAVFYDQNMVSLHPMVVHYQDEDNELKHLSFVGVTEEGKHCAPTTYTIIISFIPKLLQHLPDLKTLHYVTDSPSSQYRNKTIAALVARHQTLFNIRASWTYLESGHGKGPCDGVGGAIKKMADNSVKSGHTITNVDEFCQVFGTKVGKMTIIRVTSKDVQASRDEIASWDIVPCHGIGTAHALWPLEKIMIRETSCFEECCYDEGGLFHPSCPGWQSSKVVVLEALDGRDMDKEPVVVNDDVTERVIMPAVTTEVVGLVTTEIAVLTADMPAIHPAAMPAAIPAVNPAIIPDDMPAIIPDNVPAIHPADRQPSFQPICQPSFLQS